MMDLSTRNQKPLSLSQIQGNSMNTGNYPPWMNPSDIETWNQLLLALLIQFQSLPPWVASSRHPLTQFPPSFPFPSLSPFLYPFPAPLYSTSPLNLLHAIMIHQQRTLMYNSMLGTLLQYGNASSFNNEMSQYMSQYNNNLQVFTRMLPYNYEGAHKPKDSPPLITQTITNQKTLEGLTTLPLKRNYYSSYDPDMKPNEANDHYNNSGTDLQTSPKKLKRLENVAQCAETTSVDNMPLTRFKYQFKQYHPPKQSQTTTRFAVKGTNSQGSAHTGKGSAKPCFDEISFQVAPQGSAKGSSSTTESTTQHALDDANNTLAKSNRYEKHLKGSNNHMANAIKSTEDDSGCQIVSCTHHKPPREEVIRLAKKLEKLGLSKENPLKERENRVNIAERARKSQNAAEAGIACRDFIVEHLISKLAMNKLLETEYRKITGREIAPALHYEWLWFKCMFCSYRAATLTGIQEHFVSCEVLQAIFAKECGLTKWIAATPWFCLREIRKTLENTIKLADNPLENSTDKT